MLGRKATLIGLVLGAGLAALASGCSAPSASATDEGVSASPSEPSDPIEAPATTPTDDATSESVEHPAVAWSMGSLDWTQALKDSDGTNSWVSPSGCILTSYSGYQEVDVVTGDDKVDSASYAKKLFDGYEGLKAGKGVDASVKSDGDPVTFTRVDATYTADGAQFASRVEARAANTLSQVMSLQLSCPATVDLETEWAPVQAGAALTGVGDLGGYRKIWE